MTEPHDEAGEEDSSGNPVDPPRRDDPDGPLEDEEARARPGHPATHENFRGDG